MNRRESKSKARKEITFLSFSNSVLRAFLSNQKLMLLYFLIKFDLIYNYENWFKHYFCKLRYQSIEQYGNNHN